MPFTRLHSSTVSAGPVFASHFLDLQNLPIFAPSGSEKQEKMHTGAPSTNVEVVLKGEGVEAVESGGDPVGQVCRELLCLDLISTCTYVLMS